MEEQKQTQQALQVLEDGFQALICHLMERVPQKPCLSSPKTELLHSGILSQLLVGRAVLEAQAQLRLECLQRYAVVIPSLECVYLVSLSFVVLCIFLHVLSVFPLLQVRNKTTKPSEVPRRHTSSPYTF